MKKLILISAVLAMATVGARADSAPTVLPITLNPQDLGAMFQALGEMPYKQAAPIADFLRQKEQEAVNVAAAAQKPADAPKPAPSKP